MENNMIQYLEKLKKPDKELIKDQECPICLEPFDLESSNTLVMLPCNCANSTYHMTCIKQMLQSGKNKNFCPYCKTIYKINTESVTVVAVVPQPLNQPKQLSYILFVHIISNTLMNVINISMTEDYKNNRADVLSKILSICYFCKMLVNICILIHLKNNADQMKSHLHLSYAIQTGLFVTLIVMLSLTEFDFNSGMMSVNNVFFCFGDLAFRITVERKCINRVNAV
jgi:hypothetical protein